MSIQKHFIKFHDAIKMDYDVRAELANKRDTIIEKLRDNKEIPGFDEINQGSYAMYLGVEPIDKEYDIDVGLRFNVNMSDYEPMELKNMVYEVLKKHTEYGAKIKKPCVTVTYKKDGEVAYHVDLVIYSYEDKEQHDGQMFLARGKDSVPDEISWEKSDPAGLVNYINNTVTDEEDRKQFRRIVRYLKRWKNIKFTSEGNSEPPSIGVTLSVLEYFTANKKYDVLEEVYKYDDLIALIDVCKKIKNAFYASDMSDLNRILYRLKCKLPSNLNFENDVDVFEKMTDIQMTQFKEKLEKMIEKLEEVKEEVDEVEQCRILNKLFGEDFKIPDVKDTSQKQFNYIPSSSASGCENF